MTTLLDVQNIKAGYGSRMVLNDISLHVSKGEVVFLCGHNGAGKYTLLKVIYGLKQSREGHVQFNGNDVTNFKIADRVGKGMFLLAGGRSVFPRMTVHENLEMGAFCARYSSSDSLSGQLKKVYDLFPLLQNRRTQRAGLLSGGERGMLGLGMALMANPSLMLLYEPTLGIGPIVVQQIINIISDLSKKLNVSILLVDQNIENSLTIASRVYVIKLGLIILEDAASTLVGRKDIWDLF